ncbi:MAG: acyl-CoA dehydrogenase family protein [Neisseriaceae bacterium]|nr:acyl-CoA dehydrogenase family protein [Neisseriaceae bacterium]
MTTMIDYNTYSDADFQAEVEAWIQAHYPDDLRNPSKRLGMQECGDWYRTLSQQGWLAPGWPVAYGGMGLEPGKLLIMMDVLESYGCARLPDSGITMLGPLLIQFGSEAQKAEFLPKILSAEHIWCQGYSEPNSGSDLASLRTEAVLDGAEWVVNGQKTWTTMGLEANWMFVLVRTDKAVKPQAGISFLLIPLDTPGVEVRPLVSIDMNVEFCEVFFTNVRVAKQALVGEVNRGWDMAKALLGFERIFLGSPKQATQALSHLKRMAKHLGVEHTPYYQHQLSQIEMDLLCHNALYEGFAAQVKAGKPLGADVSVLKVHQSELFVRICALGLHLADEQGALLLPFADDPQIYPAALFIRSLQTPIYGGTNEIQRNILAKHVLGMAS